MGSLAALWLSQRAPARLWLLGRSGRTGSSPPELGLGGSSTRPTGAPPLVTLARCDVAVAEEAHLVAWCSLQDPAQGYALQVPPPPFEKERHLSSVLSRKRKHEAALPYSQCKGEQAEKDSACMCSKSILPASFALSGRSLGAASS